MRLRDQSALLKSQISGGDGASGKFDKIGTTKMRFLVFWVWMLTMLGCGVDNSNIEFYKMSTAGSVMSSSEIPAPLNVIRQELDITKQIATNHNSSVRATNVLSDENDFEAVSSRQTIESDAQRLEKNRSTYRVIEPTELPIRSDNNQPNIVEYALRTTNPLHTSLYRRGPFASEQLTRINCNRFESASKAQEVFLSKGGPKWDRLGLDPDGDGFACTWDPTPFRLARVGG